MAAVAHGADWEQLLEDALEGNVYDGNFAWIGDNDLCDDDERASWPLPGLTVKSIGPIPLPLGGEHAAVLLRAGEPAPYGHGLATVLDPEVRRSIQLDAPQVLIDNSWEATLEDITAEALYALGVDAATCKAQARLYKLLLYEPGGHFRLHRDTEKEPGMFGTLVVQLPVRGGHTGGTLRVRHRGEVREWRSAAGSQGPELHAAAFFADCEHELSAVQSGLRAVLLFNLVRTAPGEPPRPPPGRGAAGEALAQAVRAWEASGEGGPALRAIPLEHKYTETNLSFGQLKGRDAEIVSLLCHCEALDVHLALITKEVVGGAEGGWDYQPKRHRHDRWRRRHHCCNGGEDEDEDEEDEDEYEEDYHHDTGDGAVMGDVYDWSITTNMWLSRSGRVSEFEGSCFELHKALLGGADLFGSPEDVSASPDEREYEGYTGNTGPELKYWYYRSVAVVWPRSRSATVVQAVGGLGPALWLLETRLAEVGRRSAAEQKPEGQQQEALRAEAGQQDIGALQQAQQQQQQQQQPVGGEQSQQQHGAVMNELTAGKQERSKELDVLVQLVEAVLGLAEGSRRQPASHSSWDWRGRSSGSSHTVRSLRALTSPAMLALGGEARVAAVRRLLAAVAPEGLSSPELVSALAEAAATLSDPAVDDAVVAMAAKHAAPQMERCVQLATEPAAPEGLRQRVAAALMTALLGSGGGGSSGGFAALHASQVCALAQHVWEGSAHFRPHLPSFCDAVLARKDAQGLLRDLLRAPAILRAGKARDPHVARLAAARAAVLEAAVALGPPVFRWEQPEAKVPGYPQVEAFLRGPQQRMTLTGLWKSLPHARGWAAQFGSGGAARNGYSVTAEPGGRGASARVTLTKGRGISEQQCRQYKEDTQELMAVRGLMPAHGTVAGAASAAHAGGVDPTRGAAPLAPVGGGSNGAMQAREAGAAGQPSKGPAASQGKLAGSAAVLSAGRQPGDRTALFGRAVVSQSGRFAQAALAVVDLTGIDD